MAYRTHAGPFPPVYEAPRASVPARLSRIHQFRPVAGHLDHLDRHQDTPPSFVETLTHKLSTRYRDPMATAAGGSGPTRPPVELAYAATLHAAQGATVDKAVYVVRGGEGAEAQYVGMSRGRHTNMVVALARSRVSDPTIGQGATVGDLAATMRHAAGSPTASGVTLSDETAGRASLEQQRLETEQADAAEWISDHLPPGTPHWRAHQQIYQTLKDPFAAVVYQQLLDQATAEQEQTQTRPGQRREGPAGASLDF